MGRTVQQRGPGEVDSIPRRKGRARIEERGQTIEALKPWLAAGMSRRTWFRRRAEKRGKKP